MSPAAGAPARRSPAPSWPIRHTQDAAAGMIASAAAVAAFGPPMPAGRIVTRA